MMNVSALHRSHKKSQLHSSTESMEEMDTSDNTASPFKKPHTQKPGCPICSGLCSRRLSPRSPVGGGGSGFSVGRPTDGYTGTSKGDCGNYGPDITPAGSSSYNLQQRYHSSGSSYCGASGSTFNYGSGAPPMAIAGGHRLYGAGSSFNSFGDPGRPMNSTGIYDISNTGPYKSSYDTGFEDGLRIGYEQALAEFHAHGVNAANGNSTERSDLARGNGCVSVEDRAASVRNDNGVITGGGRSSGSDQLPHNQNKSNYNSSNQEIALWTDTTVQIGLSNMRNSAAGRTGFDTDPYLPYNAERAAEASSSSFPLHSEQCAEAGNNVFGFTAADKETILYNAASPCEISASSSPTHSDSNESKSFKSVRPKSRSTSSDASETFKEKASRFVGQVVRRSSSRRITENAYGGETSRTCKNKLHPSLDRLGGENSPRQIKFRKKPASHQEKLLSEYTTEVFHHPLPSGSTSSSWASASGDKTDAAAPPACSICITSLAEDSPYQKIKDVSRDLVGCAALNRCGHHFHISCLMQMATHDTSWLTCPNCQTIHGVRIGTQPKGGTMNFRKYGGNLPGFPKSSGTIEITYSFRYGNQGPEHPNPGRPYRLVGFPRVAYLPDTAQGNKVLKLLRVAFDRRLIFTVGTSATSGSTDCVVWNGIHHKTETHDSSGHGYPDPKYLDNVMMELASFGVT